MKKSSNTPKATLARRVPFWSSKTPQITTSMGTSKYHISGFHSQRVVDGQIVIDDLSLLGQRLDGADIGSITLTLKQPLKAKLTSAGAFKGKVSMILTSGSTSSTVVGEIAGKLDKDRAGFASLCFSAAARESILSLAHGQKIRTPISVGRA